MSPILIKIEVTADIAAKIRFLAEEGVFNIKTGSAELHFKNGDLLTVFTTRKGEKKFSPTSFDIEETTPILEKSA